MPCFEGLRERETVKGDIQFDRPEYRAVIGKPSLLRETNRIKIPLPVPVMKTAAADPEFRHRSIVAKERSAENCMFDGTISS